MAVFILQNQYGQFLNKECEWVSGSDANALFRSPHHDVALNHLIEVNAKDYSLRAAVITCELDSKGRPVVTDMLTPPVIVPDETEVTVAGSAVEPAVKPKHSDITPTDELVTTAVEQCIESPESDLPQAIATHA